MTLIYNNDEFASIIISVYLSVYDVMNIDINIIKQLFQVYINKNSKKENIIIINKFGFLCDVYKNDEYYRNYAYNILEVNLLTVIFDKLKIIQNLKNLINDINNNMELNEIHHIMNSYVNDIKYYCNKKIHISYISKLEFLHEKLLTDNNIEIKKDLIETFNKTIVSIYNIDYSI
jgi:hypothetical protein